MNRMFPGIVWSLGLLSIVLLMMHCVLQDATSRGEGTGSLTAVSMTRQAIRSSCLNRFLNSGNSGTVFALWAPN